MTTFPPLKLLIATGAVKDYEAISGFEEHAYSVCDDEHAPKMSR